MKAVVKYENGIRKVELQEKPEPLPGPGQVQINVKAAGVCGTDVHIYLDDSRKTNPPVILGHEVSGIVTRTGNDVDPALIGSRVVAEPCMYTCGHCGFCVTGRENLCLERLAIGSTVDGAMAEYVVVPVHNLHPIPDSLDFNTAALAEPLACCVQAVHEHNAVSPFHEVLVTGPGTIGLLTMIVLKHIGARVIVAGTREDAGRLELAARLGADEVFTVGTDDDVRRLKSMFTRGTADAVFECSGSNAGMNLGLAIIAKGAIYTQVGLAGKPVQIDIDSLTYNEIRLHTTFAHKKSIWPRTIELLKQKTDLIAQVDTKVLSIDDWEEGFLNFNSREAMKYIINP